MRKKKNRSSYVCVCVQRVTMNGTHEGTKAVSRKDKDLITKNGVNRDAEKCLAPGRNLIKIIEAATEQIITREETFSSLLFLAWKLSLQLVNCWIFSRREEEISIEIKTRLLHLFFSETISFESITLSHTPFGIIPTLFTERTTFASERSANQ